MKTNNLNIDLLRACHARNVHEVASLLEQGADPNYQVPDNEGNPFIPGRKGSAVAVFVASGTAPDARCDTMVDLLVQNGAIIPHHYKWHFKRTRQQSAYYHLIRQGMPVDYRDYWWAQEHGFDNVLDALRDRDVRSAQPVYDVDEMLKSDPSWKVIYELYKLFETDEMEPLPSVNEHERILYDAYEVTSQAVNGLDEVLQNNNFPLVYRKSQALRKTGAARACEVLEEIRNHYRSDGSEVDLEDEEEFGLSLSEEQEERIIQYASERSGDFTDDANSSIEKWFTENIRHFQSRSMIQEP